ncbi:MAG: DUF6350 family protein [Propioniciclava sp.]|uniref:cell division protein PerM n=1 Tax=Propioniciclava sp. TaxID=2038686 RepID=UPI0039E3C718
MRTPTQRRRPELTVTEAGPPADDTKAGQAGPRVPYLPWLVAALAWNAVTMVVGWAALGALISVSWLTAVHLPPAEVFGTIGQAWLSVHGATVVLGGVTLRMVPLGFAALLCLGCALAAHHAAHQYGRPAGGGRRAGLRAWSLVVAASVAGYALPGLLVAGVVAAPAQIAGALPGLILLPLAGAVPGALAGFGLRPLQGRVWWIARLPASIGTGLAILALTSVAALTVAVVAHWPTVSAVGDLLRPDAVGAVTLVLIQAAYLPNLLLSAGSFALGAGVRLGADAVLAPGLSTAAALPALPVFGAVPVVSAPADWAWLAGGVLAGVAAGVWLLRTAPAPSAAQTTPSALRAAAWRAGLAGMGAGVCWVAASWIAVGDLGAARLAGIGPRFPDLCWWGTLVPAASAALAGVVTTAWRRRRILGAAASEPADATSPDQPASLWSEQTPTRDDEATR